MKRIILAQPKLRGFRSLAHKPAIVNIGDLDRAFSAGAAVTPHAIAALGLLRDVHHGVKVLGGGTATKALTLKGLLVSAPAKAKIVAAGGKVE